MSIDNQIGRTLSMFCTFQAKAVVTLKSKRYDPFVALVKDIDVTNEDTKIIFGRCEETKFPNDIENTKAEEYITLIKNIKDVKRFTIES